MRQAILLFLFSVLATTSHSQVTEGVFSYGLCKNFQNSASLQLDYVAGITAAFNWRDMEKKPGDYDFSLINDQLNYAASCNKKLNIVLYAGNKSPEWIYDLGVPKISWKRRWKEDQAKQKNAHQNIEEAPLFWDIRYIERWKMFVEALAAEIKGRAGLGYVLITGATPKDYTTGTVIRFQDDWKRIVNMGYEPEVHLELWTDLVDHYMQCFDNEPLVVALGPLRPGGANMRLAQGVVDHVVEKNYTRVSFLSVVLNDTWFVTSAGGRKIRAVFKYAVSKGFTIGYQMNYSAHRMSSFKDGANKTLVDMGDALAVARADGVSWVEIWHDDIIHPASGKKFPNNVYEEDIKQFRAALQTD